ncbi:MAG: hypothetical protein H7293_07260 [Candidatus Saccharibacteria bacterium]|nr:hypothetical protein [Rhodoferax sp.]
MFGFGKKEANTDAMFSAVIQVALAYFGEYKVLPSEETLISDVPKVLGHFGGKMKPSHANCLRKASFLISRGMDGLDEEFKQVGNPSRLTDADSEKIRRHLGKLGVYFY